MGMDDDIKSAVKKIAGKHKSQTLTCEVVSVDWDNRECHVKHDSGLEIYHCRLRSVIDNNQQDGLCIKPKVNSLVTVQLIENQDNAAQIIGYSDVESIELKMQNVTLTIENGTVKLSADSIELNGGNNDGLVLVQNLVQKLNNLESKMDSHQHQYIDTNLSVSTTSVTTSNGSQSIPTQTSVNDLQNTKIKQ